MEPIGHLPPPADDLVARLGRWSAGRGPLYLLLAARLRRLIDEGALPPGTLLPPDRRLARALAVGRTTVVAAYDTLRQEGRLVRRQGSGTRVTRAALAPEPEEGTQPDTAAAPRVTETSNPLFLHLLEAPDDVLLLSCAAPTGPPPELTEAYRSLVLPEGDLGYHPAGLGVLRTAVAARYAARGVPTEPGQILVTTGAQQGLSLLTRLLLAPGDGVLLEAPTYPGALDLVREAAAVPLPVAVGPDGLDVTEAIRVMERHRPALAYVVARFQNPTGTVLPPLAGRRLVEAANALGVPLVDDEVLGDLAFAQRPEDRSPEGHPPEGGSAEGGSAEDRSPEDRSLSSYGEVVAVGSLSKVVWGGLRIGWVRGPAPLIARLARLKALHDLGCDVPSQLAAARLLDDFAPVLAARLDAVRAGHAHLRGELARLLPSWSCAPATGGQTLWVRLPHGDGVSFAQLALRHGVAVLPGVTTDALGGSVRHLRLHFLLPPEQLTEAVRRLAAAWEEYGRGPAIPYGPGRAGIPYGPVRASLRAVTL
ncbi:MULTISPECIES: PLP-dependent aminotransferase family protein [unclassified Streptomyces]|uniref:aminotransferase-like domain-containing protein n=1 Tax=unclassified Streptomyces TaxID=2593676 RepID=UPI0006F22CA9|nr:MULTISPECIES: PLP-dependent aminotransferase family protein [unclassified Streptomyces]KQX49555.1 GntR family transcriptional regulator [Streptomyces sp. Root1304]KRA79174.1 GntR family transcriptional regulator [Streptomyces sp. Root66D1]